MSTTAVFANTKPRSFTKGTQWIYIFWQRSFTDQRYRVLLHTGFWAFLLFFWLRENLVVHIEVSQHYVITLTGIALGLFLFYPLVYGILPLFQRRKWLWGLAAFIVYYLIAIFLRTYHINQLVTEYKNEGGWFAGQDFWSNFYQHQLQPHRLMADFFSSITGLITIIYIPLTIKFIRYAWRSHLQQTQLEKENVQLELNFLKAQINPHLLFNSLNNLQSYIVHDEKERSVELLNRLAGLLRFSLYDCHGEFVTLQQEVTLLQNYIAVESVRYDEHSNITTDICAPSLSYPLPALLLPLVENAFKFSAGLPEASIHVQLITQNDVLRFVTSNSYAYSGMPHRGGIGLQNVRKRLQHYFPDRHLLQIEDTKDQFTLTLTIYPLAHELSNR
ncbi:sensor histidine kinase [Paraflavitalea soli]|uniref:Sensor histidine kinase n=1 Tax=Paraflavitalea soli TaxID=2315862 RepID=A0A3B7MFH9_9BACT|nr:sensor histidine kinase [Paraflavitalea soli]AXY73088.1 sensor histidine kinase [Paraflavitalea soli]